MPYCIQLLAVALVSLASCYGIGATVTRLFGWKKEAEPFFELFLKLLSGLILATVSYALVRTGGVSILAPVVLLMGAVLWNLRGHSEYVPNTYTTTHKRHALWLSAALSIVVFAVQYGLVYEPGAPYLQTPYQDYVYYSRLTLPLNHWGLETNSLEAVFPQFQTEQPYHYLEIWLNALLVWITDLPSVWVFFVSAATVLISISGIGFAAIYAHYGVRPFWAMVLGLLTLSVTGTVWPFLTQYSFVANGALLAHMPLAGNPKLAPVYLAVVLVGLLLIKQQFRAAAAAAATLALLFVATAPAAITGVGGLALYLGFSRRISWKQAIILVLPAVGVLIYLGLFYAWQPAAFDFASTSKGALLRTVVPAVAELKTLLNIAIGVVLNYSIYYLGYAGAILLVYLLVRRSLIVNSAQFSLVAWGVATFLGAVIMRTLGHHFLDGFQFFSNIMIPVSAVLLAVLLGRVLGHASNIHTGFAAIILVGLLGINLQSSGSDNTSFSAAFLAQVGPVLQALPSRGGYLLGDADYQNTYMTSSDSYTAGTYVSNFKNDYLLISLSALVPDSLQLDPRFARDSAQAEQIKRRSTLMRLAKLEQLAGRPIPPANLELELVRRAQLAFICASPRAQLPIALRPLIKKQYYDARSGETLYVLHPQKPAESSRLVSED